MNDNIQQTISEKDLFTGKYFSVKALTIENNKKGYSQREVVIHSGTICLLAVTDDSKIVMHKTYRKTIEMESIELYTLKLQTNEDCKDKLEIEFLKKNNIPYKNLKIINNFYSSPSYSTERVFLYYADVELSSEKIDYVDCVCLSLEEIKNLIKDEKIVDSKTILGIYWYMLNKKLLI